MPLKWSSSSVIRLKCLLVIRELPNLYPKYFTLYSRPQTRTLKIRFNADIHWCHELAIWMFYSIRKGNSPDGSVAATLPICGDINIMLRNVMILTLFNVSFVLICSVYQLERAITQSIVHIQGGSSVMQTKQEHYQEPRQIFFLPSDTSIFD